METANTGAMSSKVELFIECQHLRNMDLLSKSDPMCVLYLPANFNYSTYGKPVQQWREVARTEWIKDNLNPKFQKSFVIDYRFEEVQKLRFAVYDVDNPHTANLNEQDFIGSIEITLGEICGARSQTVSKYLVSSYGNNNNGVIIIRAEEKNSNSDEAVITLYGSHLAKKDFFGKSDPYYCIQRMTDNGQWIQVYQSEVIKVNLNPHWRGFIIPVSKLCNGDEDKPLRIVVYDWNQFQPPELIGEVATNLRAIKTRAPMTLIDPKKHKQAGQLLVADCQIVKTYSFLDYIAGGLEMNLVIGIDWTGSNGDPRNATSLHYFGTPDHPVMNEYEQAIRAIGDILANYDRDQLYPTYGFGGRFYDGSVSHCFAINGNENQPECAGINGVLQSYRQCLSRVGLYGPTYFSHIIRSVSRMATSISQQNQKYFVLLMITDGAINDMDATIHEIVNASNLPISIIIVGVGAENFSNMNVLDADGTVLTSPQTGARALRDIVQFVPFRETRSKGIDALTRETLAELPQQVVEFFKAKKIVPNPKPIIDFQISPQVMQQSSFYRQPQQQQPQQQQPNVMINPSFVQPQQQSSIYPQPQQQQPNVYAQQQQQQSFYQQPSTLPPLPMGPAPTMPPKEIVTCMYAYDATSANELSMKPGDKIIVLSKDPNGWWRGDINGRVGFFPSNFIA